MTFGQVRVVKITGILLNADRADQADLTDRSFSDRFDLLYPLDPRSKVNWMLFNLLTSETARKGYFPTVSMID